jgi:hypothetical protein
MATDRRPTASSSEGSAVGGAASGPLGTAAQFGAMLRGSLVPTAAVALASVAVAAIAGGGKAAWSAAAGAALVIGFFSLSLLAMKRTATWQPTAVMSVVLATYTAKIIALGVVMIVLRDAAWLSGQSLALTVIVCTVVWLAFEMRAFTRMRVLVAPGQGRDEADAEAHSDEGEGR